MLCSLTMGINLHTSATDIKYLSFMKVGSIVCSDLCYVLRGCQLEGVTCQTVSFLLQGRQLSLEQLPLTLRLTVTEAWLTQ